MPITTQSKSGPKASICVVTYNQQEYVEGCITSLLNQSTNFDYEIIIADDCSTDATKDILIKLAARNPERIKLSINKTNLGPFANLINVCSLATGQYIAHCDGDDMWRPEKLQHQIDVLDANPEISGVFTNATTGTRTINAVADRRIDIPSCLSRIFTGSPLIRSSLVERNFNVELALKYYSIDNRLYDFEFYWLMHKNNSIMLLGYPYVIYNDHAGGISKDQRIFDHYRKAIERLRIAGVDSSTYNALLLDFRISNYYRNPSTTLKPTIFELLSAGRRDFYDILKIAMPVRILSLLKKLKSGLKQENLLMP